MTKREKQFELELHWAGQIADDYVSNRPAGDEPIAVSRNEIRTALRQAAFLGACDMLSTLKRQGLVTRP